MDCYESAKRYAMERIQFDKPIASFQLIQKKLAEMLTEITKSLPPQLQGFVIDFVIEATDMPKRHELADRLRAAVGIQDPEQQKQAAAAQQQAAQAQQAMQQKVFVLDAAERAARIRKLNAEAEKVQSESIRAKYEPMVRTPQIAVSAPAIGNGQPAQPQPQLQQQPAMQ